MNALDLGYRGRRGLGSHAAGPRGKARAPILSRGRSASSPILGSDVPQESLAASRGRGRAPTHARLAPRGDTTPDLRGGDSRAPRITRRPWIPDIRLMGEA